MSQLPDVTPKVPSIVDTALDIRLFILGAGVSVDHGYPTGKQLIEHITDIVGERISLFPNTANNSMNNENTLIRLLLMFDYPYEEVKDYTIPNLFEHKLKLSNLLKELSRKRR